MAKRDAEIRITGDNTDAKTSIADLEDFSKKSFNQMEAWARRSAEQTADAFKKSGLRMEKDIKKSSADAVKRYEKIKNSGVASANDIKRAHISMTKKIAQNNRELSTGAGRVSKALIALKSNILGIALAATGMGFALRKGFDFAKTGAKIKTQQVAFNQFANSMGEDGDKILKKLTEISRGTIAASDLVQAAGTAMLLGLDPSKIVDLLEIARASSKLTGESVTTQFLDIAKGTGRASRLILDNLGILFSQGEANKRMAATLHKTVLELTDAETKQGNLNEVIRAGSAIIKGVGKDYLSNADALAQLETKLKNVLDKLAIFTLKAIPVVTKGLLRMRKGWLGLYVDLTKVLRVWAIVNDFLHITTDGVETMDGIMGELSKEIEGVEKSIADVTKRTKELEENEKNLAHTVKEVTDERMRAAKETADAAQAQIDSQTVLMNALLAAEQAQKTINAGITQAIADTRKELQGLKQEAEAAKNFSLNVLEEIERSRRVQSQQAAGFNTIEKLLDDLRLAEEDFTKAAAERAAGNFEQARKLTLDAVQAASQVLETEDTELKGMGVSTIELDLAQESAKKLQTAAAGFAAEMTKAAEAAIPLVEAELTGLEAQLQVGKATLKGIAAEIKDDITLAQDLKDKLREDTIAHHTTIMNTVQAAQAGGEILPGFNKGGRVPGGYGGGDKVHALLEPGEHVIRKESISKIGRQAAQAFNAGNVDALIAALPVQQKFKEGGEVSGATTNVNLELGGETYRSTMEETEADRFVKGIKNANVVYGRKKQVF